MRRDLARLDTLPHWPDALYLVPFHADLAPEIHNLLVQGYEHGGGSVAGYASWLNSLHTDPEFNPELCFIAYDAQGLVGVLHAWTSAFIKDLVVHPRGRRQGTGAALLHHAFTVFSHRGEGQLDLKVMENNIGARRLYEKAGMRYVQRTEVEQG